MQAFRPNVSRSTAPVTAPKPLNRGVGARAPSMAHAAAAPGDALFPGEDRHWFRGRVRRPATSFGGSRLSY